MKLVVFSMCHNEEATIGELLDRIPKNIPGIDEIETLVIDDGSTDKTAKIAKEHGAKVISNTSQKRLAYCFQLAVNNVLKMEADFAVNIDGDLQFAPEEIPLLVEPLVKGDADFIAGDRFTDKKTGKKQKPQNMPLGKYLGNLVGSFIVSRLTNKHFRDVTCGFRGFNREALLNININSTYTYTQETFQTIAFRGLNIIQVPITVTYYKGRKSRVVTSILSYILTSAANILKTFRDYAPLSFFGSLGLISFILSMILLGFTLFHWLNTGGFSPYIFVAFAGIYLFSLSLIIWLFGLLADMFDRLISNQDKILYNIKSIKYRPGTKKS